MASRLQQTLIDLDGECVGRLLFRVADLGDEEYLWEPVPGCWSVRQDSPGAWHVEWGTPEPGKPSPLTTIAARMHHLGARPWPVPPVRSVAEAVERQFVTPYAPPGHSHREACGSAAAAVESIRAQWTDRRAQFESLSDEELLRPLGPDAHRFAEHCWYDLWLHHMDEHTHHAAEVGLMRDLYRVRSELNT